MKTCFIICPIGAEGSETRKRSDTLFKHIIEPVCNSCGFEPVRIDKENTNGSLQDEIISHITNDHLVIADITDSNPNAFYEIGYRAALDKPMIQLAFKDLNIPFDISTTRTFPYDFDLDAVEALKERLIQTINSINFDNSNTNEVASIAPSSNTNILSQILQEIYNIQDRIEKLSSVMEHADTSAVSVLADKLIATKSPETALAESLLLKIIDDPQKFASLAELANNIPMKE
ncbi:MAG: nucleoside 2-deoxyribosyltransferase [Lachnospiraceae bacterium]|jgi:hypothetical protein